MKNLTTIAFLLTVVFGFSLLTLIALYFHGFITFPEEILILLLAIPLCILFAVTEFSK